MQEAEETKGEAQEVSQAEPKVVRCLVCFREVFNRYGVTDKDGNKTLWYHCFCGSAFHVEPPIDPSKVWTSEFRHKYKEYKEIDARWDYVVRMYAHLIEEVTWGRKMLDVGYCEPYLLDKMRERGWIAQGIDLMPALTRETIQADFEEHNFGAERFDLIYLGDVLSCFANPMGAIRKCYKLLNPGGILFTFAQDTDQMALFGTHNWNSWNRKENRLYMSGKYYQKVCQNLGMEQVFYWRNINSHFIASNQFHSITQKPFVRLDMEDIQEELENGENDKSGNSQSGSQ